MPTPNYLTGRVLLILALIASVFLPLSNTPANAAASITFNKAVTDNYKTWQEDRAPGKVDNRTSLLFSSITVEGVTYVVPQTERDLHGSPVGAPTEYHQVKGIPLATSIGGPTVARLTFNHNGANAWSYFRLWTDGTFGPLMTIDRPSFVSGATPSVTGTFTLTRTSDSAALGTAQAAYKFDQTIADLPETSVEHNGALGRWYIAGTPTALNWAAGIAISTKANSTHSPSLQVPEGTSAVYVTPTDIAGLPVPISTDPISLTWNPVGEGRPTSVAATPGSRAVEVTLPAGTYTVQATGTCTASCRYDYQPQALQTASTTITVGATQPVYKPDAAIAVKGSEYVGVEDYGSNQRIFTQIPAGSTREFEVKVTNRGNATDTFGLADAVVDPGSAFEYTWYDGNTNVSGQIKYPNGWYELPNIAVGQSKTLRLVVTAKTNAVLQDEADISLHVYHSPTSAGIKDVVHLSLMVTQEQTPTEPSYVRPNAIYTVPNQECSKYASAAGNDNNLGTKESPVLSLNRLTAMLANGQTGCLIGEEEIVLPATGGLGIMSGGALGAPKTIRPEQPGTRATVRGLGKFLIPAGQSDLILHNVNLRGSLDSGGGNLMHVNADRVVFDGVDISWPRNICLGVGAAGQVAHDFALINSRIHDCGETHTNNPQDVGGAHGAYLQYVSDGSDLADKDDTWGAIIYNTLFDHNDARGLQLYPNVDNVLADHVVMYANGASLNVGSNSAAERSENNVVRNSILANSRLDFDDPTDPNPSNSNDVVGYFPGAGNNGAGNKITNSCLYNTTRPGYLFSAGGEGNLVLEDVVTGKAASFVSPGQLDYRLTQNSECSGMGLADGTRIPGAPGGSLPDADEPLTQTSVASIGGILKVGKVLRANPGQWFPAPEKFTYRWFVDGQKIAGTKSAAKTLTLTSAMRGKSVRVKITAIGPEGYLNSTVSVKRDGAIR